MNNPLNIDVKTILFPKKAIIGVDVGSYALKFVTLEEEKKELKLKDWGYVPLDFPPDINSEEKPIFISEEIKRYLKKKGLPFKFAATSISGNSVIVRYVKFPKLSRKEMELTLGVEAEPFIPFDINDVNLTYFPLGDVNEEGQAKMESVLIAAKKELIDDRLNILTDAGLEPIIIDVDAFVLENLYAWLYPDFGESTILVLNIGNKVSNLSIISQGVTRVVRDIFIAGTSFDRAIAKVTGTEIKAAPELKKHYGLFLTTEEKEKAIMDYNKEALAISKACFGIMKNLCNEISRSIDYYLSQGGDQSISKIFLSGGMANFGNISQYLSGEFRVPVEIANPLSKFGQQAKNIPPDILPAMNIATGLALRKIKDWEE